MKTTMICAVLCAVALWGLSSCENVSETPDVNEGYKTNFRLPEPDFLTAEDRAFIEEQEKEYLQNAK